MTTSTAGVAVWLEFDAHHTSQAPFLILIMIEIIGGDHAQGTSLLGLILGAGIEDSWNEIASGKAGSQALDASNGAAEQAGLGNLLFALGEPEELVVLLAGNLVQTHQLRTTSACYVVKSLNSLIHQDQILENLTSLYCRCAEHDHCQNW